LARKKGKRKNRGRSRGKKLTPAPEGKNVWVHRRAQNKQRRDKKMDWRTPWNPFVGVKGGGKKGAVIGETKKWKGTNFRPDSV